MDSKEKESPKPQPLVEPEPVVTSHRLELAGKTLEYTVTAGQLPIVDPETKEIDALMFFVAYTKAGETDRRRPLMFSFNGGPGSSSVWLHLGALGPKRVKMLETGLMPPPPYELVPNEHTWLEDTDLVFIDPVGTGFSRAKDKETGKKFWGLKGDIESVGEFIRLYLTRSERWTSPLFLVGESYGTTRAAGLASHLFEKGIAFNGILLISSVLNFQTLRDAKGNDLPFVLYLPSFTAAAWYHKKLPRRYQQRRLRSLLSEVEAFALGPYWSALAQGDRLPARERSKLVAQVAEYTGLSPRFVDLCNLRVQDSQFFKELLRDRKKTIGRLDARFTGIDEIHTGEHVEHDPSLSAIRPPYTSTFNDYVRRELGFRSDLEYLILGGGFDSWDWGSAGEGFPDTSEALRKAFSRNPYMKLFIASGYFDLATPYFATEYTLSHMGLDPSLRGNVRIHEYEAGHMMYIHEGCLAQLKSDVRRFLADSVSGEQASSG